MRAEVFKQHIVRWVSLSLLAAIIVVGSKTIMPIREDCQKLKEKNAELQELIDARKREIRELEENKKIFPVDRDFAESIARQNRLAYTTELVFVFDGKSGK